VAAYYAVLFMLGTLWPLASVDPLKMGAGGFLLGGIALVSITHCFFLFAPSIQGDWLSYVMVGGIPIAIMGALVKLSGWAKNLAIVVLLFIAHLYGFIVAGMHF
jgi:hypothetical protein